MSIRNVCINISYVKYICIYKYKQLYVHAAQAPMSRTAHAPQAYKPQGPRAPKPPHPPQKPEPLAPRPPDPSPWAP